MMLRPWILLFAAPLCFAQSPEWPAYGHDPGGARYSPLTQITPANVAQLQRAWTYHTGEKGNFETTPIVIDHVLYFSTQKQQIVALDPDTGREIWKFDPRQRTREHRGVAYWPGDSRTPPRIVFGTADGHLIELDAKTGRPVPGFGDNGAVNLRAGVSEGFPDASYSITSPPAIWRDLIIVGPSTQETVSRGPSGDARAFDARTGKLVWRFHTVPQPGEPGADTWGPDRLKDRAGPSLWGPITVDAERGMVFLPVGNPADSFYGADRRGTNLYANSVVALNAATGKLLWYYQMVHHDLFDYDVDAPPALVEVTRDGSRIPAVAETTKMGFLFILDRLTGKPIFGAEERPVPQTDVPGEASWPTQPFPLKPPPLARLSVTRAEVRPSCADEFEKLVHQGPFQPFNLEISLRFPGTMGGGNWGGVSFDPGLGYIFVNTSDLGGTGRMAKAPESAPMPYRPVGGYTRWVDKDDYPCQQPPWGELTAVNANTGDIAWRVPLGNYEGMTDSGTPNLGGPIATAGGLVFIGATLDGRFRAFDSRTGKEVWSVKLDAAADTVPATYMGRDGRQYVVIAAGGPGRFRSIDASKGPDADALIAFALPAPSLRGLAAVSRTTAWASGTGGTFLRTTDGGATWTSARVPGGESLDFRDVHAVDARTAYLLASGPGEKSRIYKTTDAGAHWTPQFTNPDAKGFLDAIGFWDPRRGIALGDPVDGRFVILTTADGGGHWVRQPGPAALPNEGAFAASGTCLIVTGKQDAWFGTGGARIFHSADGGRTWTVVQTPIRHDGPGAGIFSLAFSDALHAVAVGGDYTKPEAAEHNIAITSDGGRTWVEPTGQHPGGYRSAVGYNPVTKEWIAVGTSGSDSSHDNGESWTRVDTGAYHAIAFAPDGAGWTAGPKGSVAPWTRR